MPTNRQFIIDHLPKGKLGLDVFHLSEGAMPSPGKGEVLLRTRYISLDAANRAWMWGATYRAAVKAGDVMAGGALAEVMESRAPGFSPATSSSPIPAGRIMRLCRQGICRSSAQLRAKPSR